MLRRLHKFLTLSRPDKRLFFDALIAVARMRIGLTVLGYNRLQRDAPAAATTPAEAALRWRIAWAVTTAARFVPKATCLTQALAAQRLLRAAGHPSTIRIGVAREDDGRFLAHAWLMSGDHVVIGGAARDLQRYTTLADLTPRAP